VKDKTIVMTTTNGTRALRACRKAQATLAASFLNLGATANAILSSSQRRLLLVCSGTHDQTAYEDVLGAGALCDLLWPHFQAGIIADSAHIARELFLLARNELRGAVSRSRNARRLLSLPELREDVDYCLQRDCFPLVAALGKEGLVTAVRSAVPVAF